VANIAITSQCNLNCSYCFTQSEYKSGTHPVQHMSLDVYEQALDFVSRSDIKQIRILGGEPTLHPDFIPFLDLALKIDRPVRLFSNGLMPETALEFLNTVPEEKITIILNITHQAELVVKIQPMLERTLNQLNQKIMLGLNIFRKDMPLNFMLDFIRNYNLKKMVRLGLAHPCIGFKNQYLLPKHYFLIGQRIADFAREAQQQSVRINLDCGFVPCMFGPADLRELELDTSLGLHCQPIPDILPDGSIVPCYSLAGINRMKLSSSLFTDYIHSQFMGHIPEYGGVGIFKICSSCDYSKRDLCTGGCTAQKMLRFNTIKTINFQI
jgi:radical SAM protein with 4Fe4S-binding SPASM domain